MLYVETYFTVLNHHYAWVAITLWSWFFRCCCSKYKPKMVKTSYINSTVLTNPPYALGITAYHFQICISKCLKLTFFFQNRQKIWGFKRLEKSIKNPEKWKLGADRGNASQSTLHYLSFALTARLKMWASAFQNFALQPCCQKLVQSATAHMPQRSKIKLFFWCSAYNA